ncbi:MAG TPA: AraC family transcriptional regulator [Anseongella sp.]|nr:AraC family transcriptional regulator [Anseongella sp.]
MKPLLRKVDTGHNYSFSVREDIGPYLDNHWYYHPEIELTLMRKGSGMRFIGDNIDRFSEGDIILLGSNLPHMWKCDAVYFEEIPGLRTEAVVIHFREDFWGAAFLDLPELSGIRKLLEKARRGINICGHTRRLLQRKMESMLATEGAERIESLLNILQLIAGSKEIEVLSSLGFTESYDLNDADRINKIYTYTFNNFQNEISLRDVAAASNINPHSFCRYFKSRTLKTYWQFLLEVRIGYACKLLIENKMSVSQICYACGFSTLSNFNQRFKTITGKTPLQYLKEYTSA